MSKFNFASPKNSFEEMMNISPSDRKLASMISLADLVEISDQPFKVYTDERLDALKEDIVQNGLLSPLIVTPSEDEAGKYLILAGRNRYRACKALGMTEILCIVRKDLSQAQRDLILVNSNLMQRETLLPSERARALKMQAEACKALGLKLETDEGQSTAYKYLRLNSLNENLLEKVDKGTLPITVAHEISGMSPAAQEGVDAYLERGKKLSVKDIGALKKYDYDDDVDWSYGLIEMATTSAKGGLEKRQDKVVINRRTLPHSLRNCDMTMLAEVISEHWQELSLWYNAEYLGRKK